MLFVNNTRGCLSIVLAIFLSTAVSADVATLENELIRVDVDRTSGCVTVVEKVTGRTWCPDPWEGAAAVLRVRTTAWKQESWNLSKCRTIDVTLPEEHCAQVTFRSPVADNGQVIADTFVTTRLRLAPDTADLDIELVDFGTTDGVVLQNLEYPARPFSLRSNVDRGLAVFPLVQGAVVPSYLYPKPNSKFGDWDDYQHNMGGMAVGELDVYGWMGLSMPWFGIHDDKSAMAVLIPSNQCVGMQYILNYDDRERFAQQHQETPYPRILALTPVWHLTDVVKGQRLLYHFIPGGDHVDMAKYYHCFEGMAPMNTKSPGLTVIEAPLFNLVYHDAVFTANRWQSPDNDCDLNGDFAVRTLRNMLVGNLPLFVAPAWEYPGLGDQIRQAKQLVVPLHEENGDQQMLSHEFLSKNFQVQRTHYANDSEVTVNMGLVDQTLSDGTTIPGRGFRIRHADGSMTEGCFKTTLEFKTPTTRKETRP